MKKELIEGISNYSKAAMQTALSPLAGTSFLTKAGLLAGGGGLLMNKMAGDYSDQFQKQSGLPVSPDVRFGGFGKLAAMDRAFGMAKQTPGLSDSAFMSEMQSGVLGNAMFGMTGIGVKAGMFGAGAVGATLAVRHGLNKINDKALMNQHGLKPDELKDYKKSLAGQEKAKRAANSSRIKEPGIFSQAYDKGKELMGEFRQKRASLAFEGEKARYTSKEIGSFNRTAEKTLNIKNQQEIMTQEKNVFAESRTGRSPNAVGPNELERLDLLKKEHVDTKSERLKTVKNQLLSTNDRFEHINYDAKKESFQVNKGRLDSFDDNYLKPKSKKFAGWGGLYGESGRGLDKKFNSKGLTKFVLGDKVGALGTKALGGMALGAGALALIGGAAAHIANIPVENNLELATNFAKSMDYQRNLEGQDYTSSIGERHQIDDVMLFGQGEGKSLRGVNLGASGSLSLAMHGRRRG